MKELDTKDVSKITKRAGELWRLLGDDEKAAIEGRVKASIEEYEKAVLEYENRADVTERVLKEKVQGLKGLVAAATREVAKAMAQLERFQADFDTATTELEEVKQQKKVAAKKETERLKQQAKDAKETERAKQQSKNAKETEKVKQQSKTTKETDKVKQQSKDATASKKRAEGPSSSAEPPEAKRVRTLDASLLAEAGDLAGALENLFQRPGLSEKTGEQLLKALRDNDGLVNKAKNALLVSA